VSALREYDPIVQAPLLDELLQRPASSSQIGHEVPEQSRVQNRREAFRVPRQKRLSGLNNSRYRSKNYIAVFFAWGLRHSFYSGRLQKIDEDHHLENIKYSGRNS